MKIQFRGQNQKKDGFIEVKSHEFTESDDYENGEFAFDNEVKKESMLVN